MATKKAAAAARFTSVSCRRAVSLDINPKLYLADVLRRLNSTPWLDVAELLPRNWQATYGEAAQERYDRELKNIAQSVATAN